MSELCLLTVHAHPDDESSKGPGTIARYHDEGVHTVLVTCTGGEEGDILNPAMDQPGVRERLTELRMEELAAASRIIGYDQVELLGYRDSGMPGSPANTNPHSFAQAPLQEAVGRLVAIIRRERPQVLVTYAEDQRGYPHPDHLRVHEISMAAFDSAGDPERYRDAGGPWQPLKVYYTTWSSKRVLAMHAKFLELGMESPYDEKRLQRAEEGAKRDAATTIIDVTGYTRVAGQALLAHATQVDPTSRHWFGLPEDVADTVYPYEEYVLARSLVGPLRAEDGSMETDLFAGVRELAARQ